MNIKEMLAQLATTTQKAEIESMLQQTTAQLLHHYKIRAHEVELYPIELESYFYRAGVFEDPYVHTNELQANHFGELYVHRRGKEACSPYKMDKYFSCLKIFDYLWRKITAVRITTQYWIITILKWQPIKA